VILRLRRRIAEPPPTPHPRPNYTAIAVLEHDLFGVQPEPGTAAAVTIALRNALANCTAHQPVATTPFAQVGHSGMCARCGCSMRQDGTGEWIKT
jgi:hypothetical protein